MAGYFSLFFLFISLFANVSLSSDISHGKLRYKLYASGLHDTAGYDEIVKISKDEVLKKEKVEEYIFVNHEKAIEHANSLKWPTYPYYATSDGNLFCVVGDKSQQIRNITPSAFNFETWQKTQKINDEIINLRHILKNSSYPRDIHTFYRSIAAVQEISREGLELVDRKIFKDILQQLFMTVQANSADNIAIFNAYSRLITSLLEMNLQRKNYVIDIARELVKLGKGKNNTHHLRLCKKLLQKDKFSLVFAIEALYASIYNNDMVGNIASEPADNFGSLHGHTLLLLADILNELSKKDQEVLVIRKKDRRDLKVPFLQILSDAQHITDDLYEKALIMCFAPKKIFNKANPSFEADYQYFNKHYQLFGLKMLALFKDRPPAEHIFVNVVSLIEKQDDDLDLGIIEFLTECINQGVYPATSFAILVAEEILLKRGEFSAEVNDALINLLIKSWQKIRAKSWSGEAKDIFACLSKMINSGNSRVQKIAIKVLMEISDNSYVFNNYALELTKQLHQLLLDRDKDKKDPTSHEVLADLYELYRQLLSKNVYIPHLKNIIDDGKNHRSFGIRELAEYLDMEMGQHMKE